MFSLRKCRIGVVGLGYVGLPLAVEFGKHFDTIGFDLKASRIAELKAARDSTLEVSRSEFREATRLPSQRILPTFAAAGSTSSRFRRRLISTSDQICHRLSVRAKVSGKFSVRETW